uniref:Uncharacterized protein n=1 Tax=Heliothis virescens TaxID=7102 RepID=A0A2A4JT74_HELVI
MLPEHAEFFINLEKLMLLQLNEVLENPTAESIITIKEEQFVSPVPQAIPFYMFCDRGFRAQVDQNLCPKHGGTSTTTQMPAIIINRRFLYANCDNFDLFTNKIKDYIHGNRGDDVDINDDIKYENLVPVTYTPSQQLKEIQLESSLLNVVKQEIVQLTSDIPKDINVCDYCKNPLCFCTDLPDETATSKNKLDLSQKSKSSEKITASHKISSTSKSMQYHEREPKWDSYFTHVEPKACPCSKIAKKTLEHNFPVYMRQVNTSVYQPPYMPHYEMCSVDTLKALVKGARKKYSPDREIEPEEAQIETKKDMSTQYIEPEIEKLCTCFSDPEVEYLFNSNPFIDPNPKHVGASREIGCRLVGSDISPTFLNRRAQSFAMDRARSLRILLGEEPELQVLFKRN